MTDMEANQLERDFSNKVEADAIKSLERVISLLEMEMENNGERMISALAITANVATRLLTRCMAMSFVICGGDEDHWKESRECLFHDLENALSAENIRKFTAISGGDNVARQIAAALKKGQSVVN